MGFQIAPGHAEVKGAFGWTPIGHQDLVNRIALGQIDLGNWGRRETKDPDKRDAHSPMYSIPNPWAAACLFHYVLSDNTHPLAKQLIVYLLNMLSDYSLYRKVELVEIKKPELNTPFYKFWKLAPDFLKYENSMFVFRSTQNSEVVGGLSKTSLIWTSQQYIARRNDVELTTDSKLIALMRKIHSSGEPLQKLNEDRFNSFWSHNLLQQLIKKAGVEILLDSSPNSPEWLYRVQEKDLPFESILEKGWIQHERLNTRKLVEWANDKVKCLKDGFLFPIKPEYLEAGFKFDDIVLEKSVHIGSSQAQAEIRNRSESHIHIGPYASEKRSVAVWPPFASQFTPTYILEHILELQKMNPPPLEFRDDAGKLIETNIFNPDIENYRIYKVKANSIFPRYIQFSTAKQIKGFVELIPRNMLTKGGKITIGIDFGTKHTAIAYKNDGEPGLMTFEYSQPIVIADQESFEPIISRFLPVKLCLQKPLSVEEYNKHLNWQPFRTEWLKFQTTLQNLSLITSGIIPFMLLPELSVESELKWGAGDANREYRNLFLKQVILMAKVEAEAMGHTDIEIKWSYPKAFSDQERNIITSFWIDPLHKK